MTASRVSPEKMAEVYLCVEGLLKSSDINGLDLNSSKCFIVDYLNNKFSTNGKYIGKDYFEHLGVELKRNTIVAGIKTMSRLRSDKDRLRRLSGYKYERCLKSIKARKHYAYYIKN